MVKRTIALLLPWLFGTLLGLPGFALAADEGGRWSLWIDVYQGEPLAYEDVLDDLTSVRVIYLGECHTVTRHHQMQERILTDLVQRGKPLVLGLEQLESFQQAVVDVLVGKTMLALKQQGLKHVILGGGVCANTALRAAMSHACQEAGADPFLAPVQYCTDNAAMVAGLAYHKLQANQIADLSLTAQA